MNDKKMSIGFVGLGIMGEPMARNMFAAGFTKMTVFNRTPAKAEALRKLGANVAASPAEVASASDIVVSCVSDTPDVLEVVLNDKCGIYAGSHDGMIAIDCSTVAPAAAKRCHELLAVRGAGFLDAPVSGGQTGAQNATLSIMVGGDREHFDRALPVLEAMGKTITYCGPSGSGYLVKICNQILGGLHLIAAAEALSLADAAGVDLQAMLKAVSSGAAGSWMLTNLAPKMISGDTRPGFFIDYQLKDLRLAHDAAEELGTPLPAAALAETLFRAASAQGRGRDGTAAIYDVIRALRSPGDA